MESKERAGCLSDEQILDLSVCGDYVSVLTAERLCVFDETMQLYAETDETYGATRALQRADGSVVLAASGNAVLYIP